MSPPAPQILSSSSVEDVAATCAAHGLTASEFHALREHALAAKARAYCPYSNFHVGAALLTAAPDGGEYVLGANVENASYPVGSCAERVAFGRAVVDGYHVQGGGPGFKALAVATDVSGSIPTSPCGMCRQCIREFCDQSLPIIMFDKDCNFMVMTLEQILPLSISPETLGAAEPSKPRAAQA